MFQPDYVVPPGDTLRELLEERGMSQAELAIRTDMAEKTISQIISGDAPITLETARRLELVLGASSSFWNNRELAYREELARRSASSTRLTADEIERLRLTDEEREAIETAVRWLEPYPQVADKLRELLERLGGER